MKTTRDHRQGKRAQKRIYRAPRLVKYGKLGELTRGGGGIQREPGGPGSPKSKATGTVQ